MQLHSVRVVLNVVNCSLLTSLCEEDTLTIPIYVSVASAVFLVFQLVFHARTDSKRRRTSGDDVVFPAVPSQRRKRLYQDQSRYNDATSWFEIARFVLCIVLLLLSISSVLWRTHREGGASLSLSTGIVATYVRSILISVYSAEHHARVHIQGYASCVALASLMTPPATSRCLATHLVVVLLAAWAVYIYRDVWPLATYTLRPLDEDEGVIMWIKLLVLTVAAIIVPLSMPRRFSPIDPEVCRLVLSR